MTVPPAAAPRRNVPSNQRVHPYEFLDAIHPLYALWKDRWEMNARRAFGEVSDDLMRFPGESQESYDRRKDRAPYVNFMHGHAHTVTGELRLQGAPLAGSPDFSLGRLGEVRPVTELTSDRQSYGEHIYYNLDGVGGDGSEWPVFFDSVDERSQHIGHRILMVEIPPQRAIGRDATVQVEPIPTMGDFLAGRRPYLVEYDPGRMPMWAEMYGQRQFVILRVALDSGRVVDGEWRTPSAVDASGQGLGYYLLVRKGCDLLGDAFTRGGYWVFSPEKVLIRTGIWGGGNAQGEIPLWYHYGEKSRGTLGKPAESRSGTEGLGRVGVGLMDTMSARDFDAFEAAGSRKWFLGADPAAMLEVKKQWDQRSQNIAVPPVFDEATGTFSQVQLYDDSAGAVPAMVFQSIIDAKFVEAREQSFQTLTSMPDSSGESKMAGYRELKAPYLARRASYRQQSEQNAERFLEMRMGFAPRGFVRYARDYDVGPVVDGIERAFELLRANSLRSPTLEPVMALRAIKDHLGGLPQPPAPAVVPGAEAPEARSAEEYEQDILAELKESAEAAQRSGVQADALQSEFGM